MARIRSLKPGFFTNEHLAELSFAHRLCFAGLWTLADRDGRLEDRPRRIKAALFPYDDIDVEALLNGLSEKGFILRYDADGVPAIAIPTFERHQRPKSDEHPSALSAPVFDGPRRNVLPPRPYKGDSGTLGQRTEGVGADVAPLAADGAGLLLEATDGVMVAPDIGEQFKALWNENTTEPIPRCRDISSKRRRHSKARATERPLTEWVEIAKRINRSDFCRGKNDRGWVATFDWFIGTPDVAIKVLEGKYDNRLSVAANGDQGIRVSSSELQHAREVYRRRMRCNHDPQCASGEACVYQIVLEIRAKRGAA